MTKAKPAVRAGSLTCRACGYELAGLPAGMACPECGLPSARPDVRSTDTLAASPQSYLRILAGGMILVAVVGLIATARWLFLMGLSIWAMLTWRAAGGGGTLGLVVWIGLASAWVAGVAMLTVPRPIRPHTIRDRVRDSRSLAWTCRGLSAAWPLTVMLSSAAASVASPAAQQGLLVATLVAAALGVLGLIVLSVWLSALADWAQDGAVAEALRIVAVLLAAFGSIVLSVLLLRWATGTWANSVLSFLAALATLAWVIALLVMVGAQLLLAARCVWAILNAQEAVEVAQRRHEREARELAEARARDRGAGMSPIPSVRGGRAMSEKVGVDGGGETRVEATDAGVETIPLAEPDGPAQKIILSKGPND